MTLDKEALDAACVAFMSRPSPAARNDRIKDAILAYLAAEKVTEERVSEVAKMLADWRGHGMREKCMDIAPGPDEYTGREVTVRVTYKLAGGDASPVMLGVPLGYCIMSIEPVLPPAAPGVGDVVKRLRELSAAMLALDLDMKLPPNSIDPAEAADALERMQGENERLEECANNYADALSALQEQVGKMESVTKAAERYGDAFLHERWTPQDGCLLCDPGPTCTRMCAHSRASSLKSALASLPAQQEGGK